MLRQRALHRNCGSGVAQQAQDALPSDGAGFGEIDRGEPVVACVPQIRRRVFGLSPHHPRSCCLTGKGSYVF